MVCIPCRNQQRAFVDSARNGDARGMARALTAAARINADKVLRLMPVRWNRSPEPWRPPLVRHEQPGQ